MSARRIAVALGLAALFAAADPPARAADPEFQGAASIQLGDDVNAAFAGFQGGRGNSCYGLRPFALVSGSL